MHINIYVCICICILSHPPSKFPIYTYIYIHIYGYISIFPSIVHLNSPLLLPAYALRRLYLGAHRRGVTPQKG